jgi:Abortive infection alpha
MNEETVKATAEAVRATAELGSKTIDAGKSLGAILKAPLTELAGTWEDSVKVWRFQRRVRLVKRTQEFLKEQGIAAVPADLRPSFLLPLLERGEIQEDDDLQDIYACLLANAANPANGAEPRAAYVEILSQMTPLDAQNLQTLAEAQSRHHGKTPTALISTSDLPASAEPYDEPSDYAPVTETTIAVSVSNLARLGLVEPASSTFGGKPLYQYVSITPLGLDFYWACSRPRQAKS